MTTTLPTTGTLDVPGATIYHETRGTGPLVVLVGSPMDARPFAPLADLLATDHTVVTLDPRGIAHSSMDDPEAGSPIETRADDLARLIEYRGGSAAVLGSSGGAVVALALAQLRPELAHTVIAHEPPLSELLDDREALRTRTEEMIALHRSGDTVGAMRQFMAHAGLAVPEEMFQAMSAADRDPQAIADEAHFFRHEMRPTTSWRPDTAALRTAATRIVIGIGDTSAGTLCDRTSRALATALGIEPVTFPGGHGGFAENPPAFAARVREVLAG